MKTSYLMNSVKALAFVPLLLAGADAACAKQALSGDLQNQAVAMNYVMCLSKAAQRMDDGVSDANTIAARIAPVCADEFAREQMAFGNGLSQDDQVAYRNLMEKQQPQLAVNVVVSEREWAKTHKQSQRVAQSS